MLEDAFCIGCETGVGTINGLRLGRLPDVPVSAVTHPRHVNLLGIRS
jgi:hypothetical protein